MILSQILLAQLMNYLIVLHLPKIDLIWPLFLETVKRLCILIAFTSFTQSAAPLLSQENCQIILYSNLSDWKLFIWKMADLDVGMVVYLRSWIFCFTNDLNDGSIIKIIPYSCSANRLIVSALVKTMPIQGTEHSSGQQTSELVKCAAL